MGSYLDTLWHVLEILIVIDDLEKSVRWWMFWVWVGESGGGVEAVFCSFLQATASLYWFLS